MSITRELPYDGGRRKRRIYFVLLLLGAAAAAVSFLQELASGGGPVLDAGPTLAKAVLLGGLAGLSLSGRLTLVRLERLLLAVAAGIVFLTMWLGLYGPAPSEQQVLASLLWVPLLFVFCAIAFDGITSLRYGLAIFVLVVAVTLPHGVATMGGGGVTDGLVLPLQAYLSYLLMIVALYFFADVQQRAFTMEETARTMRQLANTDALTGLANRRQAEEQLSRELRRAERYGRAFSVLMIDLDHFKDLNDRFGHLAGDDVLIDLARRLERMVRASDTVARWGGEEFLLLAPETSGEDARRLAEMIRQHVDANALADRYRITLSLGVASYRPGDTVQSVVARADAALYLAKRGGRNQVRVEIVPSPGS
jgi:diguanylate cyclase